LLQCNDAVGWVTGMAFSLKKSAANESYKKSLLLRSGLTWSNSDKWTG